MHTPDGFLTNWVCVVTMVMTLIAVGVSVIKAKGWMTKQKAFLMAGLAATIFGFQMLNFPIGNGTSGHLIGGAIVAILLGPEAAVLVLTSVLLVQTFIFADGGILALGANILLMGIVAGYTAHYVYQPLKKKMPIMSGMIASWASVVTASLTAAVLLGISETASIIKVFPAMGLTHMMIGIGEGMITGGILLYIHKTKADLVLKHDAKGLVRYVGLSTLAALVVMSLALPFASGSPDGMEKVALNLGFFDNAVEIYSLSLMPDYTLLGSESYAFVLAAGIIGMAMTFGMGYVISRPIASAN